MPSVGPVTAFDARDAVDDGLCCPSGAVGDGGPAGGRQFERRHPKVLLSRKKEGAAAGRVVLHLGVGKAAQELNCWSSLGLQPITVRPIADNQQTPPQPRAGFDCNVDALVGDQSSQHQVVVLLLCGGSEPVDVNGWVDHFGCPAIGTLDTRRYCFRIGDKVIRVV